MKNILLNELLNRLSDKNEEFIDLNRKEINILLDYIFILKKYCINYNKENTILRKENYELFKLLKERNENDV